MTPPLRLLVLGLGWHADQPSGLNRYVHDEVAALRDHAAGDVDVRLVVEGPATAPPPWATVAGTADQPTAARLRAYRAGAMSVARSHRPQVVDAHFALPALASIERSPLGEVPLVAHFHGPWADEGSAAVGAARRPAARAVHAARAGVERAVYRRAARVVTLSQAFATLVVERYGVEERRVEVIPPVVDLERFTPAPPAERAQLRSELGVPADVPLAVAVRRLVPRMGLDVLLAAWAQASAGVLVVVGDGPERGALEARAAELGLGPDRLRFAGRVGDDELVSWYRAADVAVVPSVALEGFGLVVLEALACGTPVVATDVGGIPEALGDLGRRHALVVPAGDAGALARRLSAALDPRAEGGEERLPAPEACRAHAERHGSQPFAAAHVELLRAVAGA